jgi:outer membrane protein TolC
LSLEQAIETAMRSNPGLMGWRADLVGAQSGVRATESRAWPRVSFNSFAFTGDNAGLVSSSMGVDPTALMAVPRAGFLDQNLMLMAPLFTGGIIADSILAARSAARATESDLRMAAADLELRVKDDYLRALAARQLMIAEQARVVATTEMERVANAQLEAGRGIAATVSRAVAESADARRALSTAGNDEAKALLDLKMEMGVDLGTSISLTDVLAYSEPKSELAEAIQVALRNRGDVRAAELRLEQVQQLSRAVGASGAPQLYMVAMGDQASSHGMTNRPGYSAGLTLSFPIFDAGQRREDREQALAGVRKAYAEQSQVKLNAEREVRASWLDAETAAANYQTARFAVEAADAAYQVIRLRVENGKSTQVEQLDALAALVRSRANLAQALYDHAIALARLERAKGEVPAGFLSGGSK